MHIHFFAAINHPAMEVQVAVLLLRMSGVPRLGYLARVAPPSILRAAAERFDALIIQTVVAKCGLPDAATHPDIHRLITFPFRCAGMALTPHTRSSIAAYFSSLAASARTITDHIPPADLQRFMAGTDTEFYIADTHAVLLATGVDPASAASKDRLPAVATEFWSYYADPATKRPAFELQRHLTKIMTDTMYRDDPTPPQLIEAMAAETAAAGARNAARAGSSAKVYLL